MLRAYIQNHSNMQGIEIVNDNHALLKKAIWVDLLCPTKEEEKLVEKYLKFNIPSKEEMQEIVPSSRLYSENNVLFMTATMIAKSGSADLKIDAVTFILTENKLITIRYIEPSSFESFASRLPKLISKDYHAPNILIELLGSTIDRLADILENVTYQMDEISRAIFHHQTDNHKSNRINYKKVLQDIGANGDLGTKARESLVSFNRLVSYFVGMIGSKLDVKMQSQLETLAKDITALSDHATFISTKVNFLLDATLGMINIDQNNIIKIVSVAAVVFFPPTLIASIYGMNFEFMPELHWVIGYPLSIGLMILSAWLPYQYFKKRKWF
jgi:magnesium transporter